MAGIKDTTGNCHDDDRHIEKEIEERTFKKVP